MDPRKTSLVFGIVIIKKKGKSKSMKKTGSDVKTHCRLEEKPCIHIHRALVFSVEEFLLLYLATLVGEEADFITNTKSEVCRMQRA